MLAFVRGWHGDEAEAARMAATLARPAPDRLTFATYKGGAFASLDGVWGAPRSAEAAICRTPSITASGDAVLFCGWFDNQSDISARLGLSEADPALVYAHAVERWRDQAELHVVGAYAAIIDSPRRGIVRLVRSPLSAPPLHYHRSSRRIAAASVPHAIHSLGIAAELDEDWLAMHLSGAVYDVPGGWYRGIESLRLGEVVVADRDGERRCRPYDPTAIPQVRVRRDEDYVVQASALLDEAVDTAIAGFVQPATLLTGGLDSSLVATHLLDRIPPGRVLPSYTWTSEEGAGLVDNDWQFADERPYVAALGQLHPRIESHFIDNAGRGFDDGLNDLLRLTGVSSAGIGLFYPHLTAFAAAKARGCDVMITAGYGNATFSAEGRRGYVEYLRQGKWRQLRRALAARTSDRRALWRQVVSLSILRSMPTPVWREVSAWRGVTHRPPHSVADALHPDWPGREAMTRRARSLDPLAQRPFLRSRREEIRALAVRMNADGFDLMQGMQQQFGMPCRDVARYRPLVEFCWGLPTEQFLHNGDGRYLARRMARGRLPEDQRTETRYGLQHGDWHIRLARRRLAYLDELHALRTIPAVARLVAMDELIRMLEAFPNADLDDADTALRYQLALPNGLAAARLIRMVSQHDG